MKKMIIAALLCASTAVAALEKNPSSVTVEELMQTFNLSREDARAFKAFAMKNEALFIGQPQPQTQSEPYQSELCEFLAVDGQREAADALQVRLCSDAQASYPLPRSSDEHICHLTMWFFTDRERPRPAAESLEPLTIQIRAAEGVTTASLAKR